MIGPHDVGGALVCGGSPTSLVRSSQPGHEVRQGAVWLQSFANGSFGSGRSGRSRAYRRGYDRHVSQPAPGRSEPDRRTLVVGANSLAIGLAEGLAARGDRVVTLAPTAGSFATEALVADAVASAIEQLGGLDQVVHAWVDPSVLIERSFIDVSTDEWMTACEGTLARSWWLMRQLQSPLIAAGGGSVVVVVPSIALAGSAGFAMLATVAEGLRVMAKGCGRQWAKNAITVNTVATAPHHWVSRDQGDALTRAISLSTPAFGTSGAAIDDLAPVVAALAGTDLHFLTAATLVADGGLWMGL